MTSPTAAGSLKHFLLLPIAVDVVRWRQSAAILVATVAVSVGELPLLTGGDVEREASAGVHLTQVSSGQSTSDSVTQLCSAIVTTT